MREFRVPLKNALVNGLAPEAFTAPDSPYMATMYNLKPDKMGAIAIPHPILGVSGYTQTIYTQLVKGSTRTILLDIIDSKYVLKEVNLTNWSLGSDELSSGVLKSIADRSTDVTVPLNTFIKPVVSGGVWFLSGWSSAMVIHPDYSTWQVLTASNGVLPYTMAMAGGRMWYGGLVGSTRLAHADWTAIKGAWKTFTGGPLDEDQSPGPGWLMYGEPLGGDIDYPHYLELCALSGYDWSYLGPAVLDAFRTGRMGLVRVPWGGTVYWVEPFGNDVAVFTTRGVGVIGENLQVTQVLEEGVVTAGAIPGGCLFVTKAGDLWRWMQGSGPEYLGYSNYLSSLANPRILYNPITRDAYIVSHSSSKAYILTATGLAEDQYRPTSLYEYDGVLRGTWIAGDTATFALESWDLNMSRPGLKRTQCVDAVQTGCTSTSAYVKYSTYMGEAYRTSASMRINAEGVAYGVYGGVKLRAGFIGTPSTTSVVSDLGLRYLGMDIRHMRGLITQYGNQED